MCVCVSVSEREKETDLEQVLVPALPLLVCNSLLDVFHLLSTKILVVLTVGMATVVKL